MWEKGGGLIIIGDFGKTEMKRLISRLFLLPAIVSAGVILAGCAAEQASASKPLCVADANRAAAMQAAKGVLSEMQFGIEKFDIEAGYIRTQPLSGGQFFEPWRSDNVGGRNNAEANLHTIRRTVEMKVTEQGGGVCIDCTARTQRLNISEREVTSGQAYAMHSESQQSLQRMRPSGAQRKDMTWVDLGRDAWLETEILKKMTGNLKK